jgi:hypothetical protein
MTAPKYNPRSLFYLAALAAPKANYNEYIPGVAERVKEIKTNYISTIVFLGEMDYGDAMLEIHKMDCAGCTACKFNLEELIEKYKDYFSEDEEDDLFEDEEMPII